MSWFLAIAGFALLVVLHEAGHFTAAKAVGMRVERFFLFFPPKVVSITRGETENIVRLAHLELATGDLMAIAAAAVWASFNLASRSVSAVLPSSFINFLVYGFGGIALMLITADQHPLTSLVELSPAAFGSLLVMAVLASVVAGQLFLFGVRSVGVNRTVVFIYLVPVLTAVLSVLLLGESFGIAQALGGAAVLTGVYWTTRPH